MTNVCFWVFIDSHRGSSHRTHSLSCLCQKCLTDTSWLWKKVIDESFLWSTDCLIKFILASAPVHNVKRFLHRHDLCNTLKWLHPGFMNLYKMCCQRRFVEYSIFSLSSCQGNKLSSISASRHFYHYMLGE